MVMGGNMGEQMLYGGVGGNVPGIDLMRGNPEICL